MLLSPYISKLLIEYDCVIIPGLGGFVANYSSAKIHPTQHTFEPPYKQIAFNKNLTNNDGLLANAIALGRSTTFIEANKWIEDEVRRIESRLGKKEKVELELVGSLYYDVERNLQFNPSTTYNYLMDSFGLSTFQAPAIKREDYIERFEKQFKDRAALPNPVKKKSYRKLWPLAFALPVIIALLIIPFKTNLLGKLNAEYTGLNPFKSSEKPKYLERSEAFIFEIPAEKTVTSLMQNSSESVINIALTNDNSKTIPVKMEIAKVNVTFVEKEKTTLVETFTKHSYYLIAGCFKEKENADAFVNLLKVKGFDANLAGQNSSGLYRVSYHSFTDRTSALAAQIELKAENPGVWLFEN